MDFLSICILPVLYGGLGNLAAYLAAHVLLCLLPAFFIAGSMAALIPKETITRFLGRNTRKAVSCPAAAGASRWDAFPPLLPSPSGLELPVSVFPIELFRRMAIAWNRASQRRRNHA